MPEPCIRALRAMAVLAIVGLTCLPGQVRAQRYPVVRYATAHGLPSPRVTSLAQDSAGYLWFGTSGGLARYDGATMENVLTAGGTADRIVALAASPEGGIWIATRDGVLGHWAEGLFTPLTSPALEGVTIRGLTLDPDGQVVVALDEAVLLVARDGTVRRVPAPAGARCCRIALRDRRGRLWAGGGSGLLLQGGDGLRPADMGIPAGVTVNTLVEDPGGALWAGTDRGLYRETAGRFGKIDLPFGERVDVLALAIGDRGAMWVGTERGAVLLAGAGDRVVSASNGLPDDRVSDILIDREGTVWFATDGGAAKLVSSSFSTYTAAHGLPGDYVVAVEVDRQGRPWVAGRSGVVRVVDGAVLPVPLESLGRSSVTALALADNGNLLVGTGQGLIVYRDGRDLVLGSDAGIAAPITAIELAAESIWLGTTEGLLVGGSTFRAAARGSGLEGAHVTALATDSRGRLWVGTLDRGLFVREARGFVAVAEQELARVTIWDLERDGETLWVATNGQGVFGFRDGEPLRLTEDNGLTSDIVQQVVSEGSGKLWLYSNDGLNRWDPRLGPTFFGLDSGLPDLAATPGAGAAGHAGRIWFGTPSGLTLYETGVDRTEPTQPPVVIRGVWVDGERVDTDPVELGPSHDQLVIQYAGLTFRDEAATRFQYRLVGQSERWSRHTFERRVSFGALPPGEYQFEVEAISSSGHWSAEPASVRIVVRPGFWQTIWFRGAIVGLVLGLLLAGFRARLGRVEDERQRLRLMVDRRTRELVEKNALLERMATTDELTGLPNRRFFLDNMERELRKLSRAPSPQPLSLLVLDIDRFKSINDRHGHAAGDEVLRHLGRRLSQSVRATDLPARYGGEEFAILLPATDLEGARFLGEKLRSDVESMDVRYEGRRIPVTISLGAASVSGAVRYEREVEEDLLRRADEAMYRAKTGGRNRVVVDGEEGGPSVPGP